MIDRYDAGVTIADAVGSAAAPGPDLASPRVRGRVERAVLGLLEGEAHPGRRPARRPGARPRG